VYVVITTSEFFERREFGIERDGLLLVLRKWSQMKWYSAHISVDKSADKQGDLGDRPEIAGV